MPHVSYGLGVSGRPKPRKRFGVLRMLACLLVVYAAVVLLNPWAIHMGERWTPLLYWTGTGALVTKGGTYPILLTVFPSPHSSRLRFEGLRPTGGVGGNGLLCTSRGVTQYLELSGTMYGEWRSTDGALMSLRILERRTARDALLGTTTRGYFDLFGYWHGRQLSLDDRGAWSKAFRSGLRLEHASVTLSWGSKADFDAACDTMNNPAAH